jgi:hypothetical protein
MTDTVRVSNLVKRFGSTSRSTGSTRCVLTRAKPDS